MKTWILAIAMMMGVAGTAQERKARHEHLQPEQKAELQAKKMALELNLDDKQQKEVKALLTEKAKKREALRKEHMAKKEAGQKLTAEERFALKSRILDEKIEMKAAMRKILNDSQFEKLGELRNDRHEKITKRSKNFKNHKRR